MEVNGELLQGSLFEDPDWVSEKQNHASDEISANIKNQSLAQDLQDLSDHDLESDALKRPRKRQTTPSENCSKTSSNRSQINPNQEDELPAWSNHSLLDANLLTPMLRHYVKLKKNHPDRILLYRLGDFFECFFEDAILLSRVLEITLTGKEGGKTIGRVPMAGIPHHAAERYCAELVKRGFSISLCDQLETTPSKGALLQRGITRVLTPGTVIEEGMLEARRNNWLAAVVIQKQKESFKWGLASADVSTGEFLITEREGESELFQELSKINASEILVSEEDIPQKKEWCPDKFHISSISDTQFSYPEAKSAIQNHYQISTVNGIGLKDYPLALSSAGGLLSYLNETNPIENNLKNNANFSCVALEIPKLTFAEDTLIIDSQTRRNLELTNTQKDNQFQGSLLWAIDRTLTAMGGRCLRRWVEEPLMNIDEINARQYVVSKFVEERSLRKNIRNLLRSMGDLERLAGRASAGHAGARELVAIADGIKRLPSISNLTKQFQENGPKWISNLININPDLIELANIIKYQLVENPPLSLTEGGLIYDSIDHILDGLRNKLDDLNQWLKEQENEEKNISKISNLKIQYHRTFGYFLAVRKSKADKVPPHWIRRQTLSNEERFITPALKEREGKIFQLKSRAAEKEYEIFCKLRDAIGSKAEEIRKVARCVARLDSLASLAEVAATNSYCCPNISNKKNLSDLRKIEIEQGRHPVVEQLLAEEFFQPNDVKLGSSIDLVILTGPNASGKSCYLRQIGLIQILSQIGSWVPAKKATLSIADRIFTRVGAVDDLASGQSTFMVEMTETAYILNQATNNSLVLLDEIGRGTATYDGLSIAWAVSEFLANTIQSRSIFATHYHELNALSQSLENVSNFQVLVKESGDQLEFLHKVFPGGANRSYGIEAARLAGVPKDVLERAKNILTKLEAEKSFNDIKDRLDNL